MKTPGTKGVERLNTPDGEQDIEVIYTQNKEYMVLKGIKEGNMFMTSGDSYRPDWYTLIAECDSYAEARVIIDKHYQENPWELMRAIYNSMNPNKI